MRSLRFSLAVIMCFGVLVALSASARETGESPPEANTSSGSCPTNAKNQTNNCPIAQALHARVTGGSVFFSQELGGGAVIDGTAAMPTAEFGHASPYLALEVQPVVWAPMYQQDRGYARFYAVQPLVNIRLTAIRVVGLREQPLETMQTDASNPAGDTTAGAAEAPGIQPLDPSFLGLHKAVQVQLGTLLGVNFAGFKVGGSKFHWSFALSPRFMFQSVTDAERSLRVWNLDDDLYDSWVVGGRLSLYQSDNTYWESVAYLDMSWGKFQNFEFPDTESLSSEAMACISNPQRCADGHLNEGDFMLRRKPRFYAEGRVTYKSVFLGFDINNGDGRDDLRLLGGYTVELDKFFPSRD